MKVEGDKRNTFIFIAGDFGYMENKSNNDFVYLKCKHYKLCDGTANINLVPELLKPTRAHSCAPKAESYLSDLETMKKMASTTMQPY